MAEKEVLALDEATPQILAPQSGDTYLMPRDVRIQGEVTVQSGTVTASAPVLDLTQTWNNAAVTFTGLKFNATDTASGASSLLLDLQVGGASKFKVRKDGRVFGDNDSSYTMSGGFFNFSSFGQTTLTMDSTTLTLGTSGTYTGAIALQSASGGSTVITSDAAGVLAQRNGTNAQTFRLYGTYTDASNYRRLASTSTTAGAFTLSAEGLGTGATGNTLAFATDGTTRLTIAATGVATYSLAGGNGPIFVFNNTNSVGGYSSMVDMFSPNMSNGDIQTTLRFGRSITTNNAGYLAFKYVSSGSANNSLSFALHAGAEWFFTAGGLLQFAGTTSSFPALKRSGAGLISRLADDSADAAFTASTLTASSSAANTSAIASTGYSLTGSSAVSMVDLAGTWNTTGTPTAIKLNVTDTASNAASLLMDLQVGGASKLTVRKDSQLQLTAATVNDRATLAYNSISLASNTIGMNFSVGENFVSNGYAVQVGALGSFSWRSTNRVDSGTADVILWRDAAGVLAQRNAANAQTFRIYNTYTDASNYERGKLAWSSNVLQIGTEKAGTGTARALELQTDGNTRLTIGGLGNFTVNDGNSFAFGTVNGTKIGTATSQKLGFWNATPVVQPVNSTAIDTLLVDTGLRASGGTANFSTAIETSSTIKTGAPTGGTAAAWKLGAVATVSPTSPNRTIEVDIGGTIYYLHAKTTND